DLLLLIDDVLGVSLSSPHIGKMKLEQVGAGNLDAGILLLVEIPAPVGQRVLGFLLGRNLDDFTGAASVLRTVAKEPFSRLQFPSRARSIGPLLHRFGSLPALSPATIASCRARAGTANGPSKRFILNRLSHVPVNMPRLPRGGI